MSADSGMTRELARLIAGQVCLHATMASMRMAAPLLALREGYSAASVGFLLALFVLAAGITVLQVAANPYVAAERGFIDEVIMPHSTRHRIARAFASLRGKKLTNPWKKHDNIPL